MRDIQSIIREIVQIHESVQHSQKLLNIVSEAADVLLNADSACEAAETLMKGMGIIGRCVNADRVQIWFNEEIDGEMHFVKRYGWLSELGDTKKIVPQGLKFPCSGKPGWLEMFARGERINATEKNAPPSSSPFMNYYDVASLACLPLFVDKQPVGFLSVEDCKSAHTYTAQEMKIFGALASLLSGFFARLRQKEETDAKAALLKTVNAAAGHLLGTKAGAFDADVYKAMRVIANTVGVDRVYIYKDAVKDGKFLCTQIHEWSERVEPYQGKRVTTNVAFDDIFPAEWFERFEKGEHINSIVGTLAPEVQKKLIKVDVKSMLMAPIFAEEKLWGFIGFDDCRNERIFTQEEVDIIHSCGLMFMSAIVKNAQPQQEMAVSVPEAEEPPADAAYAVFKGKRILVADDIEINRDIVRSLFKNTGAIVDCVENGKEALEKAVNATYDLVLMDIYMPEMNGLEAARRIRAVHNKEVLPIIALTGYSSQIIIDDCAAVGMDAHLTKPIDTDKFNAVVNRYLLV